MYSTVFFHQNGREQITKKKNKDESQYGSTKIKLKRKIPILVFSTQCSESIIDNHIIWQH